MLYKLNELGISGRLTSWTQCFFTKRALLVKVGEKYSACIDVMSGVPQGSVVGPVVFLLYINDCLNGLSCELLCAGDVKIWGAIKSPSDVPSLQNDMDYLSNWSQGVLMSFNADKCIVLRLHPQQANDST